MEGMGLIMLHNYNIHDICAQILKNISFLTDSCLQKT